MAEVEVKIKVKSFTSLIRKLEQLGCKFSESISQHDKNFVKHGVHYENVNLDHTPVLRIRREQNQSLLTLKYNRTNELDCVEKQTTIGSDDEMEEMLKIMGYYEVMQIKKTRRKCNYNGYEICLDEVETLGSFIEVEKITEDDGEKAQIELMNFLASLGIDKKDRVVSGYDTLILRKLKTVPTR